MFENEIKYINNYMKTQLWMDFEMCSIGRSKIQIYGFIDEAAEEKVLIEFKMPYMIDGVFAFTYEGEGDFISVVEGKEAYNLNKKYGVLEGNTIFKISNININKELFIAAQNLTYYIKQDR